MDFATALVVAIFLTVLANGALQARLLRDMVNALLKMDATLAEIHEGNRVSQELARVTLETAQTTLEISRRTLEIVSAQSQP
jgi:hypothetical protein